MFFFLVLLRILNLNNFIGNYGKNCWFLIGKNYNELVIKICVMVL